MEQSTALPSLPAGSEDHPSDRPLSRRQAALDVAERTIVLAAYAHFAWQTLSHFALTLQFPALMMFVAETLVMALVLLRAPSANVSQRPSDWVLGIAGSIAPLLAVPAAATHPLLPAAICLAVAVAGSYLQIMAKLSLGRSFGIVAANRGVRTKGPYRFLRHPMYAGYALTHVGVLLASPSARNAIAYGLALVLQIWRITREEQVLMQDARYRAFAEKVRYRLVPGLF